MNIDNLETKQSKIYFFGITLLSLLAIFLTKYLLIPHLTGEQVGQLSSEFENILEMLFTTILVSVVLTLLILWVKPQKVKNVEMEVIQPYLIKNILFQSRLKTKEWWFDGNTGRYTRNVTLPELAKICKLENRPISVKIQIINPNNKSVCKIYADYRNGLRSAQTTRTVKNVQHELLATIVSVYFWKKEQPSLNIEIYLKDYFSPFRADLSDDMVIITREDSRDPAIVYHKNSFFYTAYHNDLVHGLKQHKKLNITYNFVEENTSKIDEIKKLLSSLRIATNINDTELQQVLDLTENKSTPYS